MTGISFVARFTLLSAALALAGCADGTAPVPPSLAPESPLASVEGAVEGGVGDYVVTGTGGALAEATVAAIRAAAGAEVEVIPQLGLVVVRGARGGFREAVEGVAGVGSVVPDVVFENAASAGGGTTPHPASAGVSGYVSETGAGDIVAPVLAPFVVDEPLMPAQWGLRAIDAPGAWALGASGAGARVFVLDAGIDHDHPDLAPNLNLGLSVSLVPGAPVFVPPAVLFHHGTMVAGVLAAASNGIGIAGVAPHAEIVAVRLIAPDNSIRFSTMAQAIVYAADNGADVINMSFGTNLEPSGGSLGSGGVTITALEAQSIIRTLARATQYAHGKGATLVAAAGNARLNGEEDRDRIVVPADLPHVIAVSATSPIGFGFDQSTDLDIPYSAGNYGQSRVDIAAPGGDFRVANPGGQQCTVVITIFCQVFDGVLTTVNSGQFMWGNATSMAAPHVSAVAAMLIGLNGGAMSPNQVESLLVRAADDLGKPGNDDFYGAGRLNARRAVELLRPR